MWQDPRLDGVVLGIKNCGCVGVAAAPHVMEGDDYRESVKHQGLHLVEVSWNDWQYTHRQKTRCEAHQ